MTQVVPLYRKALWIGEQLNKDPDDCYDVLLGTIKKPEDFVNEVFSYLAEYNNDFEKHS